jgi:outer membrane protein
MKRIIKILLIFCAIFVNKLEAQSLQDLISIALENNYEILLSKNQADIAKNNNTAGNAGQLPSAGISGSYSSSLNNTLQKFSDNSTKEGNNALNTALGFSGIAEWTLFNGFKVYAAKNKLGFLEQLGALNSQHYIEQTVSDLTTLYYRIVYENQLLESLSQSLEISAKRLNIEEKRKENGQGKILDYGQAIVDYQTDSISLLAQINSIEIIKIDLNLILNRNPDESFSEEKMEFELKPLPVIDSFYMWAVKNNPSSQQVLINEMIAEMDLRIQKAAKYPKIDIFTGYQYSRTTSEAGFFSSNQYYGPVAGISVNFNLFEGGNTKREIVNRQIVLESSNLKHEETELAIKSEIIKYYKQYLSVSLRIGLAESNKKTMQKVYEAAQQMLIKGTISGYEFRITQQKLFDCEMVLNQLNYMLKLIEINLFRLSGKIMENYADK